MNIFNNNSIIKFNKIFKCDFSEDFLQEIKLPDINEYVGTIYLFKNKVNSKIYIGQTCVKFYIRFHAHYNAAFKYNSNLVFHQALRKYGWDNFDKYIIWQTESFYIKNEDNKALIRDILNSKEIFYIKEYNSNDPNCGYNLTDGGYYVPENLNTKESCKKAIYNREINHHNYMEGRTYELHHLAQPILQYDLHGNFIKRWECIKRAQDELNITINTSECHSDKFVWIYPEDPNIQQTINNKLTEYYSKDHPLLNEPIYKFDLYGEFIESYNNVSEIPEIYNNKSLRTQITNTCKRQEFGNVVANYIWIYERYLYKRNKIINSILENSKILLFKIKPVYQIYITGEIIRIWDNVESIIKEYPKSDSSINKCLNHKANSFLNCIWIYEDEYDEDFVNDLIREFAKNQPNLYKEIINYNLPFTKELINKHSSVESKNYLKEHPTIYQLDLNNNLIKKWDSYKDLDTSEFRFANVSKCLRHKLKTAYSYKWLFEEEYLNSIYI